MGAMPKYPTTPMCNGALLEGFEASTRSSDIFCVTAAKCGQTWLMTLMHHLRTGGRDPDFGGLGLLGVVPWLELPYDLGGEDAREYEVEARLAHFEALSDPRVFKLHVLWHEVPRKIGSGAKVVTITRDPRDVPYSMFRHIEGLEDAPWRPEVSDFDSYFERWMQFGYYFDFVKSFWPHRDDPDVLWLRFEDLKADIEGQARRLVDFLEWDVSTSDLERVLPLVDFGHMQSTERRGIMPSGNVWRPDARFFREGAVGKNRAQLSESQEVRLLERARREFEPACYEFVITL